MRSYSTFGFFNMLTLLLVIFLSHSAIGVSIYKLGGKKTGVTCEINPFGGADADKTPLLVRDTSFVYPRTARQRTLTFAAHETVDLACPGGTLILNGVRTIFGVAIASCDSGTRFKVENVGYDFTQIKCSKNPVASARFTGEKCEANMDEAEIGFAITANRFVRTIKSCFDKSTQTSIYTYYDLIPAINQQIKGRARPYWDQGRGIFTLHDINNLYSPRKQRETINALLGLPESSTKFIQNANNYFLSRGHLTANKDFFYSAQQDSTFQFLNALPQWQTCNGCSWNQAETDVRDYASGKNENLQVWTGGFGVTTLPHEKTGTQTQLYLSGDKITLPVPEVFWKVVYNPICKKGVALITVNNPYKTSHEINYFCKDISAKLRWLYWKKDDQQKGISWACDVIDFKKTVKTVPEMEIRGLLE